MWAERNVKQHSSSSNLEAIGFNMECLDIHNMIDMSCSACRLGEQLGAQKHSQVEGNFWI